MIACMFSMSALLKIISMPTVVEIISMSAAIVEVISMPAAMVVIISMPAIDVIISMPASAAATAAAAIVFGVGGGITSVSPSAVPELRRPAATPRGAASRTTRPTAL